MLELFYPARPKNSDTKSESICPPFYLNRRLKEKEWQACARSYAHAQAQILFTKSQEAWTRTPSKKKAEPPKTKPENALGWKLFDDLLNNGPYAPWPSLSWPDRWKYHKAIGQFLFADSRQVQQTTRKRLKVLAQTAKPVALRRAISKVAHTRIQVKKRFPLYQPRPEGPISIYDIRLYRGERQFLWAFLRKEAGSPQKAVRAERQDNANRISPKLAEAYPYLNMNAEAIAKGLVNSRQADQDTADKFQCSPKTIRSLLSKTLKF